MTFDLGWHWKVKSRSLGVNLAVYHRQSIFFNISCFLHVLCYFQHLKKKWCKKKFRGVSIFFFRKTLLYHFISRFMLFSTLKKFLTIEKCPFTSWLNGRWFLQISNIYIKKQIVVLACEPVGGRSRATELPCSNYFINSEWWVLVVVFYSCGKCINIF